MQSNLAGTYCRIMIIWYYSCTWGCLYEESNRKNNYNNLDYTFPVPMHHFLNAMFYDVW